MPYRDDAGALHDRVELLEAELERAMSAIERAQPALTSLVADLAGRAAGDDVPWRSIPGGDPIRVCFANHGPSKVELVWVSYDGRLRKETTLIPGGERELETQVAHLWRMIDLDGRVVLQRYARTSEPTITLEADRDPSS
jgi:hypothetical protein